MTVGAQWGDEGKGKVVDYLMEGSDIVVRAQGGNNAGHTVITGDKTYILHLVPSGILWPGKVCVIGNGVVLDPISLVEELEKLDSQGVSITPENLKISSAAHLLLPYHRAFDQHREKQRGSEKIGTTGRGIGPAYGDKIHRNGLRAISLLDSNLRSLLEKKLAEANARLVSQGGEALGTEVLGAFERAAERIAPHICNTVAFLHEAVSDEKEILFEAAQGTFLDIDHGTYPYVTSSNTTTGGACTGSGVPPNRIDRVIGVAKAYTTRVGEGPFVCENGAFGDRLHGMGREFGATTGRERRCGWFDSVLVRYSGMVNGIDELALTNLDGLDGLDEVQICVAYELDGQRLEIPPVDQKDLDRCQPIYETLPGWKEDISQATSVDQLPANAAAYLEALSQSVNLPISLIGVGPDRKQTLVGHAPGKQKSA
ncbi:MAG: adenylosuccinate synthase [Verrucomicrobiota bacterium]